MEKSFKGHVREPRFYRFFLRGISSPIVIFFVFYFQRLSQSIIHFLVRECAPVYLRAFINGWIRLRRKPRPLKCSRNRVAIL